MYNDLPIICKQQVKGDTFIYAKWQSDQSQLGQKAKHNCFFLGTSYDRFKITDS